MCKIINRDNHFEMRATDIIKTVRLQNKYNKGNRRADRQIRNHKSSVRKKIYNKKGNFERFII